MKVALFLGSGVSLPSGLPTVDGITQKLLYSDWHQHTSRLFCPGPPPDTPIYKNDPTEKLQQFLRAILRYSRSYFNDKKIPDIQYEDLYFVSSQLKDEAFNFVLNPIIDKARDVLKEEFKRIFGEGNEFFGGTSENACNLIKSVCYHELSLNNNPLGFDFLYQIHNDQDIGRIDIFTLNHDLLIEKFLNGSRIGFNDGFDPCAGNGNVRFENFSRFDDFESKIRLFKLHGSIDLFLYTLNDNRTKLAGKYADDGRYPCDNEGNPISDNSAIPLFITGTHNKPDEYTSGIHAAMLNIFNSTIREHDVIIMSGYGWGDGAINSFLLDWLYNSINHKLIVLHKKPFDIFNNPRCGIRWDSNEFGPSGRIRVKKKWLCCTKLNEIKWILDNWELAARDQKDIAEELRRRNPTLDDHIRMLEGDNSE